MILTGVTISNDKEDYDYIINRYKKYGLNMFFYDPDIKKSIRLGSMSYNETINYITYLNEPKTYSDKAWYKVLNDVLIKIRKLKIEKIKLKI